MKCHWQPLISLLPVWMRDRVDKLGKDTMQELRVRSGHCPELVLTHSHRYLDRVASEEDIRFIINTASNYSPWAAETIANGYITATGGHRIGICGNVISQKGSMTGIRTATSLCLRVARDFPGIATPVTSLSGSVLIIGPPGSGKTTLLRDLIRQRSDNRGDTVSVVDEKGELFPYISHADGFYKGKHTDVLNGCTKRIGIETVLKNMGPSLIAVDEITAAEDCDALIQAGWCGVNILATAHAWNRADLYKRPVYRPILESGLFENLVIIGRDKSLVAERMQQ